jgi:hypothetical protein
MPRLLQIQTRSRVFLSQEALVRFVQPLFKGMNVKGVIIKVYEAVLFNKLKFPPSNAISPKNSPG